ncbi:MAG: iron-sulfur cluster assembly protein, partial [Paracoccaceae bacterium]
MAAQREAVLAALKQITDPVAGTDIVASGVMRALNVDAEGAVRFVLEIAPSHLTAYEAVKAQAETAVGALNGVSKVSIVLTGHSETPPPDLRPSRPAAPKGPERIPGV